MGKSLDQFSRLRLLSTNQLMGSGGVVYVMANKNDTVLYIGSTVDLFSRVQQHKNRVYPNSFTARYKLFKLVYFEILDSIEAARDREFYLKKKKRQFKDALIDSVNPAREDLWEKEVRFWNQK